MLFEYLLIIKAVLQIIDTIASSEHCVKKSHEREWQLLVLEK